MIATWMLYCVLCAAGVALAALVAERALAAGRAPLRYVWVGAVMLSVWVPVLAYRYAPRQAAPPTGVVLDRAVVAPSVVDSTVAATLPASPAPTVARTNWRAMVTRADDTLVGAVDRSVDRRRPLFLRRRGRARAHATRVAA